MRFSGCPSATAGTTSTFTTLHGQVKNQVTKGQWVVRGVDRVDDNARQIYFRASGLYPDQDPYYVHYCRINFDGTQFVKLTEGDGNPPHRLFARRQVPARHLLSRRSRPGDRTPPRRRRYARLHD